MDTFIPLHEDQSPTQPKAAVTMEDNGDVVVRFSNGSWGTLSALLGMMASGHHIQAVESRIWARRLKRLLEDQTGEETNLSYF